MFKRNNKKEWGTITAIIIIVLIILVVFYVFFTDKLEKEPNKNIALNKDNVEVIDNQNNTFLKKEEVDIDEIEKRLDELDINLDDIFEKLD
jgi:uncharacterized protein YoxC